MIKSIEIDGKDYEVSLAEETDEGGNNHAFLLLEHGAESYRLSPSTTEEELQRYADPKFETYQLGTV